MVSRLRAISFVETKSSLKFRHHGHSRDALFRKQETIFISGGTFGDSMSSILGGQNTAFDVGRLNVSLRLAGLQMPLLAEDAALRTHRQSQLSGYLPCTWLLPGRGKRVRY